MLQNPVKPVGHNVTEARGKHQEATQLTEDKSYTSIVERACIR